MKRITLAILLFFAFARNGYALTVSETEIAGKTNLVAVAQAKVNGREESILTDHLGLSLYTFAMDSSGVSKCSGGCLEEWPPLHVPAGTSVAAPFGTIKGNDGKTQLTLQGLPLYHYDDDKQAGDVFGQYPEWDAITVTN